MKTLRITFLTSSTYRGGTYVRASFLSKYLAKEGHRVSLIISSEKASFNADRKRVDGVDVFTLPSLLASPDHVFLRASSRIVTSLMHTLFHCILEIASDSDVLHSFDVVAPQNATPTLLSRILRSLRIHEHKIFVDWDEWWGHGGWFSVGYREYSPVRPLMSFLEVKVPLYADAVTVPGEALRQRALWAGVKPGNLFVIRNGANVDFIKPLSIYEARKKLGLPIRNVIYSHFGPIDMESLKLLMVVHKKVVTRYPNALLMFASLREEQMKFVRARIKSLDLARNILCVEWQPYDRYPLYLGASDILLLPLQDNIYDRVRSQGLRLSDYIAAGRPVVATGLPEITKAMSECALLAKPDDPEDFASKVLKFMGDLNLREELGKRARKLAEAKYSWQIVAKKLEQAYYQYL